MNNYIEEKTFEREDFTQKPLPRGEYDNCVFLNCNFLNANLSNFIFSETEFKGCDLSNAKINQTAIKDIKFKDCKLLGFHFDNCNEFLFSVEFENCTLNFSTFYKLNC
jgi:fluoroquinolone resistance protein